MNHDEAAVEAAEKDFFERRGFHPDAHTWKDAQYGLELRTFLAGVRWREESPDNDNAWVKRLEKRVAELSAEVDRVITENHDLADRLESTENARRSLEAWAENLISEREALKGKLRNVRKIVDNLWFYYSDSRTSGESKELKDNALAIIDELLGE